MGIQAVKGERVRLRGTTKTGTVEGIDWKRMLCVKVMWDGCTFAESVSVVGLEALHTTTIPEREGGVNRGKDTTQGAEQG